MQARYTGVLRRAYTRAWSRSAWRQAVTPGRRAALRLCPDHHNTVTRRGLWRFDAAGLRVSSSRGHSLPQPAATSSKRSTSSSTGRSYAAPARSIAAGLTWCAPSRPERSGLRYRRRSRALRRGGPRTFEQPQSGGSVSGISLTQLQGLSPLKIFWTPLRLTNARCSLPKTF
jgi:hypothetical protein